MQRGVILKCTQLDMCLVSQSTFFDLVNAKLSYAILLSKAIPGLQLHQTQTHQSVKINYKSKIMFSGMDNAVTLVILPPSVRHG